jgi:hypothetical protein
MKAIEPKRANDSVELLSDHLTVVVARILIEKQAEFVE